MHVNLTPDQARRLVCELVESQPAPGARGVDDGHVAPQSIGPYRIVRVIGRGGMGIVYEGRQRYPSRALAIKVLNQEFALPSALVRFDAEVEALARLDHAGIARLYDARLHAEGTGGLPCFAMQFVPGAVSLTAYAHMHGLDLEQRLTLFVKVCDAAHHAHERGIIHRDLKPANILVPAEECPSEPAAAQPLIIDFGIAQATDSDVAVTTIRRDVRELLGTLQYMSPEQCEADGRTVDARSDVYVLGLVLYELLCGRPPYVVGGSSLPGAIRTILEQPPEPPGRVNRALRGNLEAIMLKALAKGRAERFQCASELAQDVRRCLAGQPVSARPSGAWARALLWAMRRPVVATAMACALVVILTVAGSWAAVWWFGFKPHEIVLADDHSKAQLKSAGGSVLGEWSAGKDGIPFAGMFVRTREGVEEKLAIVAFAPGENEFAGCIWAFALDDLETPVWRGAIEDGEVPPDPHGRRVAAREYGLKWAGRLDVFSELPGEELVVIFQHGFRSQCVVRVYDTTLEARWELWHDGNVTGVVPMPGARRLVLWGLNGTDWSRRGNVGSPEAPFVVFAVDPEPDWFATSWVGLGSTGPRPAWYRCLGPPEQLEWVGRLWIQAALPADAPGSVRLTVDAKSPAPNASFSWALKPDGSVVGPVVATNEYERRVRAGELPEPDLLGLFDIEPFGGPTLRRSQP